MIVQCPCCARPMEIEPHKPSSHWSLRQTAMIRRMISNGLPSKVVGRLFGVNPQAIREFNRRAPRIFIPRIAPRIEERDAA